MDRQIRYALVTVAHVVALPAASDADVFEQLSAAGNVEVVDLLPAPPAQDQILTLEQLLRS